ncbi:MAG: hypothetical protein ABI760_08780 [Ferruginibacter sp.]
MIKANMEGDEISEKIRKGLDLSFKKLVLQKSLIDGILVFSKDDKIIKVKATDLIGTLSDPPLPPDIGEI